MQLAQLSSRLQTVESKLQDDQADIMLLSAPVVKDIAAQALLFTAGDQPQASHPSRRFQRLSEEAPLKLVAITSACSIPLSQEGFCKLAVIDTWRNMSLHTSSLAELDEAVGAAAGQVPITAPPLQAGELQH